MGRTVSSRLPQDAIEGFWPSRWSQPEWPSTSFTLEAGSRPIRRLFQDDADLMRRGCRHWGSSFPLKPATPSSAPPRSSGTRGKPGPFVWNRWLAEISEIGTTDFIRRSRLIDNSADLCSHSGWLDHVLHSTERALEIVIAIGGAEDGRVEADNGDDAGQSPASVVVVPTAAAKSVRARRPAEVARPNPDTCDPSRPGGKLSLWQHLYEYF